MDITQIVNRQREYYLSGATRPLKARKEALRKLKTAIIANEQLLLDALEMDLHKPSSEAYMCEIGIVLDEIRFHLKHLHHWTKNKTVPTPLAQFCSKSFVSPEPYGVVLIMAPWNYPVQLCLSPLVGAISAGNCAVLKPSAYTPTVSAVLAKMVRDYFPKDFITVVEGGRAENTALLEQRFDYIFFTGSTAVGKIVMEAAAKNLTPVSLELGGKSPVIVDETANIDIAARRIAFGKILNAGQTCVAPDYLFVHHSVKEQFIKAYQKALAEFFPNKDLSDMPRIINDKHFARLTGLLVNEKIIIGGATDEERCFIEPTVIDDVRPDAPIMQQEIFGPILPIIEFTYIEECIHYICAHPKPLALYLFTLNKQTEKQILDRCSFGGGCINDTIIHLATPYMGFGGVGASGMGSYHGKNSFDTFTHYRSIVKKRYRPDIRMRYRPYTEKKERLIRKFLK